METKLNIVNGEKMVDKVVFGANAQRVRTKRGKGSYELQVVIPKDIQRVLHLKSNDYIIMRVCCWSRIVNVRKKKRS